jgi:uncharacterized protein (TIGR02145 family)
LWKKLVQVFNVDIRKQLMLIWLYMGWRKINGMTGTLSLRGLSRSNPVINKLNLGWIASLSLAMTVLSIAILGLTTPSFAQATDASSDLTLSINSVVSLSITNCDSSNPSTVSLSVDPTSSGAFKSTCQNVSVAANTPGYYFLVSSSSIDLVYQNPTAIIPVPVVASTDKLIDDPAVLPNDTWGFAVEKQTGMDSYIGFDTSYTIDNADNKYAQLPDSELEIYVTDKALGESPAPLSAFKVYYAAKLTLATVAGDYRTTITYSAIGEDVPEPIYPKVLAVVPDVASTVAPSGDGAGSNGPQFSIAGRNLGSNPIVTIGGQPCTEIAVNSDGTAITCSGPTAGLAAGDKAVIVTTDVGVSNKDKTVAYDDTDYLTLQSVAGAGCGAAPTIYRDTRDSQLYYVAKLDDNKCWMLDNLRYKPNGDTTGTDTAGFSAIQVVNVSSLNTLTVSGSSSSGTNGDNFNAAKYIDPIDSGRGYNNYCETDVEKSIYNITKCGLLYNFYTSTAGTAPNTVVTGNAVGSICPAGWRLPTGGYNTSSDFAVLNGSMHAGSLALGSTSSGAGYDENWLYSGDFAGVFSGDYGSSFGTKGSDGYFWSSSVSSAERSYSLRFNSANLWSGNYTDNRYHGFAVRCVIGS